MSPSASSNTSIGLGILSWKGGGSLKSSLESYQKHHLFSLFDEKIVFLPEQGEYETKIVQSHNLSVFGNPQNLGILGGFKAMAESMTSEYVLLLENDCPLIEDFTEAQKQITLATHLLSSNQAHIVRLRHREHTGEDWSVLRKYRGLYPAPDALWHIKLKSFIHRLLRSKKASRLKGWSIYSPESKGRSLFPDAAPYHKEDDYYLVDSAYLPWTNQSILLRREFFLDIIIRYAEMAQTKRRINGFRNLEIEMNSDFWRQGHFKICVPKGLFTHRRIGDRGYKI
ncbi:MAG: hypothetical protein ACJARD_000870 [Alphaproteobacteria bacterium]|jgi:hypothetical protein